MLKKENGFSLPIIFKFPEWPKYLFVLISLFIVLISIYSNSFYGDWHFDDYANIVDNPYIQIKSLSWPEIKHCIYGLEQERPSRPLSYLSFALNYYFHGKDVFGYHVVNFAIHYLTSVFLFLFIFNTLKLPRLKSQYESIAYPIAILATFFWAVHPVWVTSVTYVVQRMASMAGLFYIASMYFYLKARTNSKTKYSLTLFAFSLLFGLASVLTKENAAMLPVSILLFDLFLIAGITKQNVIKYAKIALLPVIVVLIAGFIYVDFSNIINEYKIRDFTMFERVMTQPRVILFYLSLLLYPISSRLTFLYDIEVSRSLFQPWTTMPSIFLILSIVIFALYIARKRPLISFCIIFYFLNHLIEGSIFNLELIYEHRNYLPSMLLFVPVAEFIIYAIDYFSYNKIVQFIVALGIAVILIGEGDITYNRNKIVSDDFLLWFDNIEKSPALSRPHANTGRIYFIYNQKEKALQEYKKAMTLNNYGNNDILAIQQCNLGILYFETMQDDLAIEYFRKSSEILPDYIQTNIHMAKIKLRHNKIEEAKQIVLDKLKKYRSEPKVMELLSLILVKNGQINSAQFLARKLLAKDTDSVPALMIMAEVCRIKNNYPVAILYWKAVRSLSRYNAFANLALIELYANIKDTKMLNEEIRLLFYLKGSLKLREYIKLLNKDENLNIYAPKIENFLFITKKCLNGS
ncbi:tpr repeat [hydrocarbon metagenome]|uniref:Tpr repeat n=1 Tax=hydrocarbon metagenome TaxID=938273 RepID=A0A0W8FMG3_9ZZZZ